MNKEIINYIISALIFVLTIAIGTAYVYRSSLGYTESAILFLTGILAAGMFWVGRKR